MFVVSVGSGAQEKRLFDCGPSSRQPFGDVGGSGGRLAGTSDGGLDAQRASQRPNPRPLGGGNLPQPQGVERRLLAEAAQKKAEQTPPRCPVCGHALTHRTHDHERTYPPRFGPVTKRCCAWTPFGVMTAGVCAFRTSNIKTLTKIEMRRAL